MFISFIYKLFLNSFIKNLIKLYKTYIQNIHINTGINIDLFNNNIHHDFQLQHFLYVNLL